MTFSSGLFNYPDSRPQRFLHFFQRCSHIRIDCGSRRRFRSVARAFNDILDSLLNLANGPVICDRAMRDALLTVWIFDRNQSPGVPRRNFAGRDHALHFRLELNETNRVTDGDTVLSRSTPDFLMTETEVARHALKSLCQFDRIEVFTLDVFDQSNF